MLLRLLHYALVSCFPYMIRVCLIFWSGNTESSRPFLYSLPVHVALSHPILFHRLYSMGKLIEVEDDVMDSRRAETNNIDGKGSNPVLDKNNASALSKGKNT